MTQLRDRMLEELERRNYSPGTARCYLHAVQQFAEHFHRSPDRLGAEHIREYQLYLLRERKLSPKTLAQQTAALRFFYIKTLKRKHMLEHLPFPKLPEKLPTVLSREEVSRLLAASANRMHRTMLMTLYATGVRRAELCQLKTSDIDSRRMIVHVRQGKGGRDRDVPLSPALLEALRAYWRWMKPKTYLFPGLVDGWRADVPITDKMVWFACQRAARAAGIEKHITPHTLRLLYDLLFRASAVTMLEVAQDPKHLGADIGLLSVLHSWGQNLQHHPHIHCIVPAGGLTKDRSGWIAASPRFFLPVHVLSRVFRDKFAAGLNQLFDQNKLQFHGSLTGLAQRDGFHRFSHQLSHKNWVVYAKPPFGGAEHVLHYLARYTHRVAISNHRLVALHDDRVSFRWKDYAHGGKQKLMTLPTDEFLRRFLLHVLPKGLVRIRHFGLFANRRRTPMLALCRSLLGSLLALAPQLPAQQLCPLCSGAMVLIERLTAYQLDLRSTLSLSKQPGRSFDSS